MEELRNKIPEGWKLKKISDIGYSYGGLTGKRKDNFGVGSSKYISFLNVLNNPIINTKILEQVDVKAGEKQNEVRKGDLFFNTSSETPEEVGICSVLLEELCNTYLNSFCFGFRLTDDTISGLYLAYYFRSKYGRELMTTLAQGATRYNLSKNNFEKSYILVPETNSEQNKIALCLSNIDTLISQLEVLIEKKKAIKQGAMQELLTGKRRLKGFKEPWVEKRLGDILDYEQPTPYLVTTSDYFENGIPVLTAGKTFILGYTHENFGIFNKFPVIIFDDFVTESKYVDFPFKAKSSAMKMLSLKNDEDNLRFVYEVMQAIDFPMTDHKRYWIAEYSQLVIKMPSPQEQSAIANILLGMDNDISSLEIKRSKYCAIKQGMMQQLLTGKIRLI